jgi:hypothetical protein
LKDEQVVHVSRAKTVKEAWENLKTIHETRSQSSALIAKRTFYSLQADEGCDIKVHVTEMTNKRNQLDIMGCEIPDAEFKALLVMSLPKSWESWTASYLGAHADKGESQKIAGYTSQELISIIIDESNRRKSHDTQEKGYYAKAEKGGKKRKVEKKEEGPKNRAKCNICGRHNHPTDRCRFKNMPKCNSCGKFGHETKDCWGKDGPGSSSKKYKGKEHANMARDEQDDEPMDEDKAFVVSENVTMNEGSDERVSFCSGQWVADSATMSHIMNRRTAFTEYTPLQKEISGIGNVPVEAIGRGAVEITTKVGNKAVHLLLRDVLHVPTAGNNLLSISQLDEQGGRAIISKGQISLLDDKHRTIATGRRENRLYFLDMFTKNYDEQINTAKDKITWEQLHIRYGHIGITGLKCLLKEELVDGLEVDVNSPTPECEACIQAKHSRQPFPKNLKIDQQFQER